MAGLVDGNFQRQNQRDAGRAPLLQTHTNENTHQKGTGGGTVSNLENALTNELPNLDAIIEPSQVTAMRKEFERFEVIFRLLKQYCQWKEDAMTHRLAGKIVTAKLYELQCDRIYKQLPEWAKW
jgi:hypothetical protein